jgi:HEAT repeat protein
VIGDRIALPAVTELVAGAEGFVVIEALNTLAGIDLEQSKRVIAGALDNGDADVVKAAIETLADCEDTSWIEERRDMLLAHPDWDVRCRFIRLLADRLGSAAFPALRSRLVCETDVMVRGLLNDILGRGC